MKWNNIHKALPECNQKCLVRNRNLDEYEYNIAVFHVGFTRYWTVNGRYADIEDYPEWILLKDLELGEC